MRPRRAGGEACRWLAPHERAAALELVRRVRACVPAELVRVFLFGSKARGEGRPDSDVDVLLVFRRLPPDREPQASQAEALAEQVAEESGIPVTVWSVSLPDLERGNRTPMLVDALHDGVPLWPMGSPRVTVELTPEDALHCVGALLQRVREGSVEVADRLAEGDAEGAARRARDDVVRLCIAGFLLVGETRPRRADAVRGFLRRFVAAGEFTGRFAAELHWAANSFGPDGRDEERPVRPPPRGIGSAARLVDALRAWVARRAQALERALAGNL